MFDADEQGGRIEDEYPHLNSAAFLTRPIRNDLENHSQALAKARKSAAAHLTALKRTAAHLEKLGGFGKEEPDV